MRSDSRSSLTCVLKCTDHGEVARARRPSDEPSLTGGSFRAACWGSREPAVFMSPRSSSGKCLSEGCAVSDARCELLDPGDGT